MRSRTRTPDSIAAARADRDATAPARRRAAAAEASAPAQARRARRNAEQAGGGTDGGERATHTRTWRQVRRREDNAPPQPGPGPEFVEDPPPSPESLRGECIEEIQEGLGLDDRAIGAVFGVSERTIEEWRRHGVPAAHVDTLRRLEKQNRSARRRAQRTS